MILSIVDKKTPSEEGVWMDCKAGLETHRGVSGINFPIISGKSCNRAEGKNESNSIFMDYHVLGVVTIGGLHINIGAGEAGDESNKNVTNSAPSQGKKSIDGSGGGREAVRAAGIVRNLRDTVVIESSDHGGGTLEVDGRGVDPGSFGRWNDRGTDCRLAGHETEGSDQGEKNDGYGLVKLRTFLL